MITSVRANTETRDKLKAVSLKRKKEGTLPNKQVEILAELVNKLHAKEFK